MFFGPKCNTNREHETPSKGSPCSDFHHHLQHREPSRGVHPTTCLGGFVLRAISYTMKEHNNQHLNESRPATHGGFEKGRSSMNDFYCYLSKTVGECLALGMPTMNHTLTSFATALIQVCLIMSRYSNASASTLMPTTNTMGAVVYSCSQAYEVEGQIRG